MNEKRNEKLTVRKATQKDTEKVLEFYHAMIDEMVGTNFDILWKRDQHPSDSFLRESVQNGFLIIGTIGNGEIASALIIDRTAAPGYEKVPWRVDANDNELGIVHCVATRPAYHGQGFASKLFQEAISISRQDGLRALRLDTFIDNVRSHGLYKKIGLINHGSWPVYYDDLGTIELDMFEYVIEDYL